MIDVVIHVELRGMADESVYAELHQGMLARKWRATLTTDDKQDLPLPDLTYSGQTEETVDSVSQTLHDWIVASIWNEGATVLVTELTAWSISGDY
ncbi:hypothetical protein [Granulicella paludicola]|uniref:hypothetical protein n=1 Tax=Granulicella paludicola TaxID=474951 RepID=UPI0021E0AD9F|nr:hypothetical protein [Granulicella paludicola]